MNVNKLKKLENQLIKTIPLLEAQYSKTPTAMMELIVRRYKDALKVINANDITKLKFHIEGSVRAYLDSANDYMNPVLKEMDKAENLLKETFL